MVGGVFLSAQAQIPIWVTPDVPTDETLSGNQLLPWQIWKYDGAGYTPALSVPGNPDLNAIHKMDLPNHWLFSVEAPSDLGGFLMPAGTVAEPRDVIWFDAAAGIYQLCMQGATVGIPASSSVDAIHTDGGDAGDLIVSFDVPTDVVGFPGTFEPSDLVRFGSSGIGVCAGYSIVAANPDFAASGVVPPVPISTNAEGADGVPNFRRYFAFDVPTDLPPAFAGATTIVPGQIMEWDSVVATWALAVTLGGWPISSVVDGISCGGATPGRVDPPTMKIGKGGGGSIVLIWPGSCAAGAQDYGIYEGTIGIWNSHTWVVCTDAPPLLTEPILPSAGNRYYLVVPLNTCNRSEGSYGRCSPGWCGIGDERPVGAAVCAVPQVVPTPPACP
jgi:hypothetical protein